MHGQKTVPTQKQLAMGGPTPIHINKGVSHIIQLWLNSLDTNKLQSSGYRITYYIHEIKKFKKKKIAVN